MLGTTSTTLYRSTPPSACSTPPSPRTTGKWQELLEHYKDLIPLIPSMSPLEKRRWLPLILQEEEESVDWHEAQLHLVKEVGKERYLAEMIHEGA